MEGSEALIVIAEVSVALAGFAGIVAVFRQGEVAAWPSIELFRFRFMVEVSLFTLLASTFPFVFFYLSVPDPHIWALSSGLFSIVAASYIALAVVRIRRLDSSGRGGMSRGWTVAYLLGTLLVGATQAVNALAVFRAPTFGLYLVGPEWLLFLSSTFFVRLLFSKGALED